MNRKQQEQIAFLQWLRLFAAAAVVLMHTAAKKWMSISYTTDQWQVLTAWDSLVRWPVPVFLMITGALFLPRKTELKTCLTRYIPRMAVAWCVWSGANALYSAYTGTAAEGAVWQVFLSGQYHLWYLPFLCGIYLVLPFVQRIATDKRLTGQLLAVSCVIGLAIPWVADVAALLLPDWAKAVRTIEGQLNYSFFFDHLAILLLGHWLYQNELSPRARGWLYAGGLAGVAVTWAGTLWATGFNELQNSIFFDFTAPGNLCLAAALFVFARHHLHSLPKIVDWLAKRSFGVYLSHALIIDVLADQGLHVLTWDPVWSVPVLAALVFAISLAVTAVLERIPLVGKYLT